MSTYTTKLETLQQSVGDILDAKLNATSPAQTVDYVAFALDNLSANVERAKQAKRDLDDYIKEQSQTIAIIKEDTAKWLIDTGIDKLDGMVTSSMTIYTPAESRKLTIIDKDYFLSNKEFTKVSIDEAAVKKFLLSTDADYSEYAEIETIHNQPQIKINKRKAKND